MAKRTTAVKIKFTLPGIHHWPDAPPRREYLKQPHRHLFYFEVSVQVKKDDREIEFHDLQHLAKTVIIETYERDREDRENIQFGTESCEMIAAKLMSHLEGELDLRPETEAIMVVQVTEDDENGARVVRFSDDPPKPTAEEIIAAVEKYIVEKIEEHTDEYLAETDIKKMIKEKIKAHTDDDHRADL